MVATKKKNTTTKIAPKSLLVIPDSSGASKNESSEIWGTEIEQLKSQTFSSLEEAVSELAGIISSRMDRVPTFDKWESTAGDAGEAPTEVVPLDHEDEKEFFDRPHFIRPRTL